MKLDHATILTNDLARARHFFCDIAGLKQGRRPPFNVHGYWLYAQGRAVIHLIGCTVQEPHLQMSARIDHAAFRVETSAEWEVLLQRLKVHAVPYQLAEIPLSGELQLFVELEPGVLIEFVMTLAKLEQSLVN